MHPTTTTNNLLSPGKIGFLNHIPNVGGLLIFILEVGRDENDLLPPGEAFYKMVVRNKNRSVSLRSGTLSKIDSRVQEISLPIAELLIKTWGCFTEEVQNLLRTTRALQKSYNKGEQL